MFNFNKEFETIFKIVAQNADKLGISAYFVGGMLRDQLMGIKIKDIDILIEGSAIDFVQNLASLSSSELNVDIKSVHDAFNTAKTVINGIEIDFASTREEDYPKSGCLPVVKNIGCPVECDLKRRDFTVNAIAARLLLDKNELKYELIDPFNGSEDIKPRTLRVLHEKSYIDDPTRILRGVDFKYRFNFNFGEADKFLIKEYLKSPDREGLSIDRVKLTLKNLFSNLNAKESYKYILENEIYKIWSDTPAFKADWAQRLYDSSKIFNTAKEDVFLKAIFECPDKAVNLQGVNSSNYEIYKLYKNFKNIDLASQYAVYNDCDAVFYYKKLKDIKPDITGDELIKQGFKQGKELGDELSRCLEIKLNSISRD